MDKFEWGKLGNLSYIVFVIAALAFILWGYKRKAYILENIFDKKLLDEILRVINPKNRMIKTGLILAALFFIVIAAMEPKYDFTWEKVNRKGVDIIIALDTSKSMYASDISPSRFERSKLEIKNLINNLQGDRIGLVIFTSKAITQCPLTLDYSTFNLFLDEIEIGSLPKGGTSLYSAVDKSIESFDKKYKKDRVLILVTDGETHDENIDKAVEKAKENAVKIFTIGLGSKDGVPIIIPSENGEKKYLKDEKGDIVLTKLNDEPLKKLALHTNGAYIQGGSGGFSLEKLYTETIAPLDGRDLESQRKKRYEHRFYIPLFLAILCLFIEGLLVESPKNS